jgi:hypothetical protein
VCTEQDSRHCTASQVWQQNFHEYSEYAPSSLLSFPLADEPAGPGWPGATTEQHPYSNLPDLGPPALPPKRTSRSHTSSFRSDGGSLPPPPS